MNDIRQTSAISTHLISWTLTFLHPKKIIQHGSWMLHMQEVLFTGKNSLQGATTNRQIIQNTVITDHEF